MSTAAAPFRRPHVREVENLAASMLARLPRGVAEALADPIVQALMAADGVDPRGVATLMYFVAVRLSDKRGSSFSW
jgi:hypothetical protein